jgi:hypothetical protein
MSNKTAFLDHSCYTLGRASSWRHQQAIRYPDDHLRNTVAAKLLFELASQAGDISDSIWTPLRPFFNPKDSHYSDAVSRSCRDVGFRTNPRHFDDFAQTILDTFVASA